MEVIPLPHQAARLQRTRRQVNLVIRVGNIHLHPQQVLRPSIRKLPKTILQLTIKMRRLDDYPSHPNPLHQLQG
jgi:hypothetical protein